MNNYDGDETQLQIKDNRIWPRIKCEITTHCTISGVRWSCILVDLSAQGFGLLSTVRMHKGAVVNFSDSKMDSQVVWTAGNRAGLVIIDS